VLGVAALEPKAAGGAPGEEAWEKLSSPWRLAVRGDWLGLSCVVVDLWS